MTRILPCRIIFNFGDRCNMRCPFCYVPFRRQHSDFSTACRVVNRAAELGFKVITFGGGDPFLYPFLPSLVSEARKHDLIVHIDTNALAMTFDRTTAGWLQRDVTLIGLPLDGPSVQVHAEMRSTTARHFDCVCEAVRWTGSLGVAVKINTVVSRLNVAAIPKMLPLVESMPVGRWSLYQYLPLGPGALADEHTIGLEEFYRCCEPIQRLAQGITVEAAGGEARTGTYPFVSQDGGLYVHANSNQGYRSIGSIFDDEAALEAMASCQGERVDALARYL